MIKVSHRVNRIELLKGLDPKYGVEVDIRTKGDKLIIHHDPYCDGDDFEEYLKYYKHKLLILNTKEEGLEERLDLLMKKHNIKDYFYLDLSLPFLVNTINRGQKKVAVRFSEYEPIEFVEKFKGKADWVWVDCFNEWPLDSESFERLNGHFRICLVSPELQNKEVDLVKIWRKKLEAMKIDAVCTKNPNLWT